MRDESDFQKHMDYIHYNPVKHGLVKKASDWPYSTFHRYVGQGVYGADWAGASGDEKLTGFGE
jgi:putative transposase